MGDLRKEIGQDWTDYHRIRIVNYLRSIGPKAACEQAAKLSASSSIWNEDKFLFPVMDDDALLFADDFEDDEFEEAGRQAEPEDIESELARLRKDLARTHQLLADVGAEVPKDTDGAPDSGDPGAELRRLRQQLDQASRLLSAKVA